MKHSKGYGSDACAPETRQKIADAQAGEQGFQWRGVAVEYNGIHKRARAALPTICALTDSTCVGRLEIALRRDAVGPLRADRHGRGDYSPNVSDYWRLCRSHHNRYDGKRPPPETRIGRNRAMAGA